MTDVRAENRAGEVFVHYKHGGVYRRLFDALLVPSTYAPSMVAIAEPIFRVLHSDDPPRSLPCVCSDQGLLVIDNSDFTLETPVVVYVSTLYHTIWCRPRAEFHGTVDVAGRTMTRFVACDPHAPKKSGSFVWMMMGDRVLHHAFNEQGTSVCSHWRNISSSDLVVSDKLPRCSMCEHLLKKRAPR